MARDAGAFNICLTFMAVVVVCMLFLCVVMVMFCFHVFMVVVMVMLFFMFMVFTSVGMILSMLIRWNNFYLIAIRVPAEPGSMSVVCKLVL